MKKGKRKEQKDNPLVQRRKEEAGERSAARLGRLGRPKRFPGTGKRGGDPKHQ